MVRTLCQQQRVVLGGACFGPEAPGTVDDACAEVIVHRDVRQYDTTQLTVAAVAPRDDVTSVRNGNAASGAAGHSARELLSAVHRKYCQHTYRT